MARRRDHFIFPKPIWPELLEQGRIAHHPVLPEKPGPAARAIRSDADVEDVIALMRINYERHTAGVAGAAAAIAGGTR